MWGPQIEALASRYKVVTIDRRGFGKSTAPPDLDREIDDILALMRMLGEEKIALVGMSQGGRVALRFAYRHRDRLWALVLNGSPLDGHDTGPVGREAIPIPHYAALAATGALDELRDHWRNHLLMSVTDGPARALVDLMLADYAARDLLAMHSAGPVALEIDLARLPVPTLVLLGQEDTGWLHEVGATLTARLPDARMAKIGGAGHLANMTHPAQYNAALLAFLNVYRPADDTDQDGRSVSCLSPYGGERGEW